MKNKEELIALKAEVEAFSAKLAELSDDELTEVTGGKIWFMPDVLDITGSDDVSQADLLAVQLPKKE